MEHAHTSRVSAVHELPCDPVGALKAPGVPAQAITICTSGGGPLPAAAGRDVDLTPEVPRRAAQVRASRCLISN